MRFNSYPYILRTKIFLFLTLTLLSIIAILLPSCQSYDDKLQKNLEEVDRLIDAEKHDEALTRLLDINDNLQDNVSPEVRSEIANKLGTIYYTQYQREKAHYYVLDAVNYSRQAEDKKALGRYLWNLALAVSDMDSLTQILGECRDINRKYDNTFMENKARIFLSRFAAIKGDSEKAKLIYDSIAASNSGKNRSEIIDLELEILHSDLCATNDDYEGALNILHNIKINDISLDGKVTRFDRLYKITKQCGDYNLAFSYRDSMEMYRDSINSLKISDRTSKIENEYSQRLMREKIERNVAVWSGIGVAILLLIIIFFLVRQRKLKTAQLALIEKISDLNIRIAALTTETEEMRQDSEMEQSIAEKLRLTKAFFQTRPQYSTLKRLNLLRDTEEIDRQKSKEILDAVIGQFADACANLCHLFPTLTKDDSLYCAVFYTGFSKEVASVALKASEDALRRRKSRIKQKLSPEMFEFIFN